MTVYFLQDITDGSVKIGCTQDLVLRTKTLENKLKCKLMLLRAVQGNFKTEKWIHSYFFDLKLTGEWFRFSPDMLTVSPPYEKDFIKETSVVHLRLSSVLWKKISKKAKANIRSLGAEMEFLLNTSFGK